MKLLAHLALVLAGAVALTPGPASSDEPTPAEPAAEQAVAKSTAVSGEESGELKLPPGFKPKKRGKYTLYCRTDTPLGTRFKSETCFDADQIRDYIIALQENKSNVDRIRATCSNVCACGQPDAC